MKHVCRKRLFVNDFNASTGNIWECLNRMEEYRLSEFYMLLLCNEIISLKLVYDLTNCVVY